MPGRGCGAGLVVLQHQSLRRIAIQGVVRDAGLEQAVESAQKPELGERLNGIQSWPDLVVMKLSRAIVEVGPDSKPLDEIPELPQHVLREEAPVGYWVGKGSTDHIVSSALHLLLNRRHRSRSTSPKDWCVTFDIEARSPGRSPPQALPRRTAQRPRWCSSCCRTTEPRPWSTPPGDNRTTQEPTNGPLFKTPRPATPAPDLHVASIPVGRSETVQAGHPGAGGLSLPWSRDKRRFGPRLAAHGWLRAAHGIHTVPRGGHSAGKPNHVLRLRVPNSL